MKRQKYEEPEQSLKYKSFVDEYSKAYPLLLKSTQYSNAQKLWKQIKDDEEKHDQMIVEFRAKAAKSRGNKLEGWIKFKIPSSD